MTHFFLTSLRILGTFIVIFFAVNAIAISPSHASEPLGSQNKTPRIQLVSAQIPSNQVQENQLIPVLLLAEPGLAYVLSAPSRQLQITVEGENGLCLNKLTHTDSSGTLALALANTKNCASPRLVVSY